jgi:hypothetical protein
MHDRAAGSIVVGRVPVSGPWGYPYGPGLYGLPSEPWPWQGAYPGAAAGPANGPAAGPGYPAGPGFVPPDLRPGPPVSPVVPEPEPGPAAASDQAPGLVSPADLPRAPGSNDPGVRAARSAANPASAFASQLPAGLRLATFRRRVAAYFLDGIVILLMYSAATELIAPTPADGSLPSERLGMLAGFVGGLAQAVYFVVAWAIWRRTIGQKAAGLQVGAETGGRRLGPIDALVRWAVLQGPLALMMASPYALRTVLLVVAAGWAGVLSYSAREDPDGRAYHDRVARSLVVEDA